MLSEWNFDNSYLELPQIFFSKTKPNKFNNLKIILKNEKLVEKLSINKNEFNDLLLKSIINNGNCFSQAYASSIRSFYYFRRW